MADDLRVDEPFHISIVREADEEPIRPDLAPIGDVAILEFEIYVSQHGPPGDDPLEHLVVERGPHRLLEPPELAVQSCRLELPPHGADLADVHPPHPQVLLEKSLQEREVQIERLHCLALEASH